MTTKGDALLMAQYDLSSAGYNLELANEHGLAKRVSDIEQEVERIYYKEDE